MPTFDLIPDVRQNIQNAIEATLNPVATVPDFPPDEDDSDSSVEGEDNGDEPSLSSSLMNAENSILTDSIVNRMRSFQESSIWESGVAKEGTLVPSPFIIGSSHIGSSQINSSHIGSTEIGFSQVSTNQLGSFKSSTAQISTNKTGSSQVSSGKAASNHFGATEVTGTHIVGSEVSATEISFSQNSSSDSLPDGIILFPTSGSTQVGINEFNSEEISLPSSIPIQKFISSHLHNLLTPLSINNINSTALNLWNSFIQPQSPFDIALEIKNLPQGQLAEAQVTKFDPSGRPIGGTILIDDDANGIGWYIDPAPSDNSEYAQALNQNAYRATTGDAYGKYDLFTTVLHEMGHIAGFIAGHEGFDRHLKTRNGTPLFVTDDLNVTLTPDGSHLDSQLYPFDLMNTTLSPGVRKLPSALNLQLLKTIREDNGNIATTGQKAPTASLTSAPLVAINNGDFSIANPSDPNFGWRSRGGASIFNGQALLTEDSPLMSNFNQTFIVPEGAKTLQFTLTNTQLGHSELAPPDAFEVALLDSNTKTSLIGNTKGLTLTDSFLNLQADGTAYYSDGVNFTGVTSSGNSINLNNSRTISLDISHLTPGTSATLYFDLLGFGAKDSRIGIDNVRILNSSAIIPTPINDSSTTIQGTPVTIDILDNDLDAVGTIQIGTTGNGTVIVNENGTITYTPGNGFVGTDSFTYTLADNEGILSSEAVVTVTVLNSTP